MTSVILGLVPRTHGGVTLRARIQRWLLGSPLILFVIPGEAQRRPGTQRRRDGGETRTVN